METLNAHGKLLGLLCLALAFSAGLMVLAGCGGLLPDRQGQNAAFQSYDQLVESYNEIVPGMTNAQDLPNLGFDTRSANVAVLSPGDIAARFLRAPGVPYPNPAVRDCIRAAPYCTGFVFHPGHASGGQPDAVAAGFLNFRSEPRRSAYVTLLVMNGRVVHKVFSRITGPEPAY
ncbi:MAG TPA: hypothetical protein VHC39_09790 [Rhizomicrobium sp.]|nr:hypothetical protein [Rhizomicrobium sp.]